MTDVLTLGLKRISTQSFVVSARNTSEFATNGVPIEAPVPPKFLVALKLLATGRDILTIVSVVAVVASMAI